MRRRALAAAIGACLALFLFAPEAPSELRSAIRLHDFAHVPIFAVVALLAEALARTGAPAGRPPIRRRLWILGLCVASGIAVEIAQGLTGRDMEGSDVARDAAGSLAALLALAAWEARARPRRALALLALAAAPVLIAFAPVGMALFDERRGRAEMPLLADFERPGHLGRFAWQGCRPEIVASDGGHAARVRLLPGRYPRFGLRFFPRDWRAYAAVSFTCVNPTPAPFRIVIRVDDRHHDGTFGDRFTTSRILAPGETTVVLPLEQIAAGPRRRRLDLGAVHSLILYGVNLKAPQELIVDDFRLLSTDRRRVTSTTSGGQPQRSGRPVAPKPRLTTSRLSPQRNSPSSSR